MSEVDIEEYDGVELSIISSEEEFSSEEESSNEELRKKKGEVMLVQNIEFLSMGLALDEKSGTFSASKKNVRMDERANLQILRPFHNIFYFEILITKAPKKFNQVLGVGFAPKYYYEGMTGWYLNSIGLHADDGKVWWNNGGMTYPDAVRIMKPATKGDVMGAYWNKSTGEIRFTKNGKVLETEDKRTFKRDYQEKCKDFLPTISLKYQKGIEFQVMLGGKCLRYQNVSSGVDMDLQERTQVIFDCELRYFGYLDEKELEKNLIGVNINSNTIHFFRSLFV